MRNSGPIRQGNMKRSAEALNSIRLPAFWSLAALLLFNSAGCQSGMINATELPIQYRASIIPSAQSVNLSQLARTTTGSDIIQSEDLLSVAISTGLEDEDDAPRLLRVAVDGSVNVPLVGLVRVSGMELPVAEAAIQQAGVRSGVFRNPSVSVELVSQHGHQVTVLGAVSNPGTYSVASGNSDVLTALVAAGGLREDASTNLEIRHPPAVDGFSRSVQQAGYSSMPSVYNQERTVQVDLTAAQSTSNDELKVQDGTVITVPPRKPPTVYVMGLVRMANQYEIPPDEDLRLLGALALAGGRRLEVADRVRIVRQVPGRLEPIEIQASVREAQRNGAANIRIADGDVVQVAETPMTFTLETLRALFRFGVSSNVPGF